MWCPEGYKTLDEARNATLAIARRLVYLAHPASGTYESVYSELRRDLPPEGAINMAYAMANWMLEGLLGRPIWSAAKVDGSVIRVDTSTLLRPNAIQAFASEPASSLYNPITTIGPPPPTWMFVYDVSWDANFTLVDTHRSIVRIRVTRSFFRCLLLRPFWLWLPDGLMIVMEYGRWSRALFLARKIKGRTLCIKNADLEDWSRQTARYLDAFLGVTTSLSDDVSSGQKSGPGRAVKERREVAKAILDLYGPDAHRSKSWKETGREISAHLQKTVSLSTLRRAFEEIEASKPLPE